MINDKWINIYSRQGVLLMTLAFFGVMYLINLISYGVGNLLR